MIGRESTDGNMRPQPLVDQPYRREYDAAMPTCANCGAAYEPPVYRTTLCESCPGSRWPFRGKDRANFCDWFSPAADAGSGREADDPGRRAKQAFSDLFGDD